MMAIPTSLAISAMLDLTLAQLDLWDRLDRQHRHDRWDFGFAEIM